MKQSTKQKTFRDRTSQATHSIISALRLAVTKPSGHVKGKKKQKITSRNGSSSTLKDTTLNRIPQNTRELLQSYIKTSPLSRPFYKNDIAMAKKLQAQLLTLPTSSAGTLRLLDVLQMTLEILPSLNISCVTSKLGKQLYNIALTEYTGLLKIDKTAFQKQLRAAAKTQARQEATRSPQRLNGPIIAPPTGSYIPDATIQKYCIQRLRSHINKTINPKITITRKL